ncbi:MAG: HAMP domain-containing histidine kinase [Bacteroidales bacterium]|nr:HAMP domain-containing histidine kinase [Bacteroidales bacterium]
MNIKFNILIVLSVIALFFAIASQYVWTQKTYDIIRSNQKNLINLSITKSADEFTRYISEKHLQFGDSLNFVQCDHSPGHTHACFADFDSILDREFGNNNLKCNVEYAFIFEDSIIFKSKNEITDSSYKSSEFVHKLYCGIFSTGLTLHIIADCPLLSTGADNHLDGWLVLGVISMLLITIILIFFIRLIRKIQKTSKERIKVINNMAHEFKTPISSINLASEMLAKEEVSKDTARVKRYADLISFENTRLKFLGDQILQIAMLEEQQISLNFSSLDANEVIKTYVENYMEVRLELRGRINLQLEANNPFIQADKGHFENVIKNLIENAIKYGGEDVLIVVSTGNIGQNLLIIVSDNGVGIPKSYHKKIFERFYRIIDGNQHDIKGFGIGLYYIRSILNKMNGKISLDSSPGKGAKFTITIKQ